MMSSAQNGGKAVRIRPTIAIIVFLLLTAVSGFAIDYYWDNGGADSSWFTVGNWNPDGIPLAADNVCVKDCASEADCTPHGMHCLILDASNSPPGICLAPCTSNAGCGGNTCDTQTGICVASNP